MCGENEQKLGWEDANAAHAFPYQVMFGKSPERLIRLLCIFGCLAWVNVPKVKRDNKKLDQWAVASIFLGYSLERKGWLFYSPDYSPNIFWSNSARFMETKCWSDKTEWKPVNIHPPPALADEGDIDDLGYTDMNLFDEWEEVPLVRGLAPETQVGLSRYSVTIKLCDSYCLGIGDYQVVRWRSLCILS